MLDLLNRRVHLDFVVSMSLVDVGHLPVGQKSRPLFAVFLPFVDIQAVSNAERSRLYEGGWTKRLSGGFMYAVQVQCIWLLLYLLNLSLPFLNMEVHSSQGELL
jgi:hypothetical protein